MTIKKQFEIMKKLSGIYDRYYGLTNQDRIQNLKSLVNDLLKDGDMKVYVGQYIGKGRWTRFQTSYSVMILRDLLEVKTIGNNAIRYGQQGDYILFKKNKNNIEILDFLKSILNIL